MTNKKRVIKKKRIVAMEHAVKHFEINQISALNNPFGVDIPLNKHTKTSMWFFFFNVFLSSVRYIFQMFFFWCYYLIYFFFFLNFRCESCPRACSCVDFVSAQWDKSGFMFPYIKDASWSGLATPNESRPSLPQWFSPGYEQLPWPQTAAWGSSQSQSDEQEVLAGQSTNHKTKLPSTNEAHYYP